MPVREGGHRRGQFPDPFPWEPSPSKVRHQKGGSFKVIIPRPLSTSPGWRGRAPPPVNTLRVLPGVPRRGWGPCPSLRSQQFSQLVLNDSIEPIDLLPLTLPWSSLPAELGPLDRYLLYGGGIILPGGGRGTSHGVRSASGDGGWWWVVQRLGGLWMGMVPR